MQEGTVISNKYPFNNNGLALISVTQGLPAHWNGSKVAILWSGDYNALTVEMDDDSILFRMYINDTQIYSFTSPVGTTVDDIDKIYIGFLWDIGNQVAKPSFVYDTGSDTYAYNQEEPTNSEMAAIFSWLSLGATTRYDFDYTGSIQTFTAPETGTYLLETWGAQGGNATDGINTARGGYGAYAKGEVSLTQGDVLYIGVGGQNGYNGGGMLTRWIRRIIFNGTVKNLGSCTEDYPIPSKLINATNPDRTRSGEQGYIRGASDLPTGVSIGDILFKEDNVTDTYTFMDDNNFKIVFGVYQKTQGTNRYGLGIYCKRNSTWLYDANIGDNIAPSDTHYEQYYFNIYIDEANQRAYLVIISWLTGHPYEGNGWTIVMLGGKYNGTDIFYESFHNLDI